MTQLDTNWYSDAMTSLEGPPMLPFWIKVAGSILIFCWAFYLLSNRAIPALITWIEGAMP